MNSVKVDVGLVDWSLPIDFQNFMDMEAEVFDSRCGENSEQELVQLTTMEEVT